jgi:hypothetical protein
LGAIKGVVSIVLMDGDNFGTIRMSLGETKREKRGQNGDSERLETSKNTTYGKNVKNYVILTY